MTTLLYLHGVGDDGTRRDWWDSLTATADTDLSGVRVVAPDFSDLLTADLGSIPFSRRPPVTPLGSTPVDRRRFRADQAERYASMRAAGASAMWPHRRRGFARVPGMIDAIGEKIVIGMVYEEVGNYIDEEMRRRAILGRVLTQVPTGRVVIVGHSLGALVALEIVRHLPEGVHVPLLVTAASALARRKLPPDLVHLNAEFPYDRVDGWVNVFNTADPVTRGLPIGMRFPQAIDVAVSAGFADHNLASCLADPGVASAIARAAYEPARPTGATGAASPELDLSHALSLAQLQMTWHMEQLLAADENSTVSSLTQFMMARRVVGERSAIRGDWEHHDWDRDNAQLLRDRVAERDLPAVLVRLAGLEPMSPLSISVSTQVEEEARRRVAADLGVPPAWLEGASRSRIEAAAIFRPLRRRGRPPQLPDLDESDSQIAASITASVQESLRPLAVSEGPGITYITAGLGDIRPACTELIARALTAHRLGTPAAGAAERRVLSQLMVLLGEHRARVGAQRGGHERVLAQLRRRAATVAASLSWLARQGVGLEAAR